MTFSELYQQVVNYSDREKINIARNSFATIANFFEDGEKFAAFIVNLTAVFAGADNLVSRKEHELFITVTDLNWDYETFYNMVNEIDDAQARAAVDNLLDKVGGEFKDACLMYGLAFLSIDDKITAAEKEFFERIWG